MSKRPAGSPVASGRGRLKHFVLNIKKKVEPLMKLEKSASMKRLSEEYVGFEVLTAVVMKSLG
jgi:hypothetical protein